MSLKHLKLCVEKLPKHHTTHLQNISKMKNSIAREKNRAAFYASKLWPKNSKITIGFINDGKNVPWTSIYDLKFSGRPLDPLCEKIQGMTPINAVKKVVTERIIPLTGNGITITFVNDYKLANVRVNFNADDGSWAYLGTDHLTFTNSSDPTVNFGWIDAATIEHEFGHVLGMIHEHQNPNGNAIQWNKEKVYEWAKQTQGWDKETTDSNIIERYDSNQINGSVFDPMSIMLYFFPAELTLNNQGTEQNLRLSGNDVLYITTMYPNGPITPENFYQDIYNESLKASLTGETLVSHNNTKNIILIVITFLILYFLINFLF